MAIYFGLFTLFVAVATAQKQLNFSTTFEVESESRIINGRPASAGQFPWQAYVKAIRNGAEYVCGGALICDLWVLTAAHCVHNVDQVTVYLGSINRVQHSEAGRVVIPSAQNIMHESYNHDTLSNDVALIKLRQRASFNDIIKPIRLGSHFVNPNVVLTVSGWGKTADGGEPSATLNYVDVNSISNEECARTFGSKITAELLCTKGSPTHSACQGDSGGPLVQQSNGQYVHVGVVSFTAKRGCALGEPVGFARTSSYLNWVQQRIGGTCQLV